MTRQFVRVAAMGIAGCIALSAMAETFVWQGASGGSWNDAANWAGGVVPNASGAEVDFSAVSGTYAVSVDAAVTVGKIVLDPPASASLTLSGEKITFAAADTPEVEVGANGTLYLQNVTGGSQGLRKTGTGTYRPSTKSSANCYSGRTYVDAGTVFLVKDSGAGSFGGSVEVAAGATFKWDGNDELDTYFYPYANGGTFDMNGKLDYIGNITFSNGGVFRNGYLFIDNAAVAKISTSGDGFAGTFNGSLFASSLFMASSRGNIHVRTQEVNVASANATLAMTGWIFDNRADSASDPYKKEYRYNGTTPPANPPPYQGQLRKTGAGDLLLYDENIALSGPTTVADGRLILSNSIDMLRSTIKLAKDNSSLVVAPNATLKLSGLDGSDTAALDLHGSTLDIGGLGEDAVFAGTLANGGANVRKISSNSQTFTRPQTQRDWDVLGGTLHFGAHAPVVWYTFDDASDLGRDSGSAGKNLSVSNAAGVVWSDGGVTGGCASFNGTGCLKSETAVGLPGGNSAFTIALWIKPTTSSFALVTWGRETGPNWNGFVSSGNNKLKHVFWEGENDYVSTPISGSFTDGTWRHVAVTYNPATGTRTFYVDGAVLSSQVLVSTRAVSLDKPFYLGIGKYSNNFKGKMDDVMVFDTELSQADIARLAGQRTGAAAPVAYTPAGGTIRLEADATISFRHAEESFASISGRGTLGLYDDSVATIAPAANTTNEVGRLAGDGTLVKNGAGTLALSRLQDAGGKLDVRAGDVTAKGPAAGLKDHLLAWWTFDDPENPGADASGNGMTVQCLQSKFNDAIYYDTWSWPNRFLTTGGAAYFDGNNQRYLVLADKANEAKLPSGANPTFTVAMWINPDSTVANNAGFCYWGSVPHASKTSFGFRFNAGTQINPWIYSGGDLKWTIPGDFKTKTVPEGWHHIAFSVNGGDHARTLYVDGVGVACTTNTTVLAIPATNFSLGFDASQKNIAFKGYMDDVMIFSKALSSDEVRAVMQGVALEEPAGGMAAVTASGTSFAVTDGQVAFSGLAATGTVSVAAAAEALFAGGENVLAGALVGAGTLTVTNGASLALTGGQDFGGTLAVRAGGALALVPDANARVQTLQLAEGVTVTAQPAGSAAPAIVSTDAVALPASAIVRVAVPESASGFTATLVESTAGLTGDVDGWTLDATLPAQGSWRAGVRKVGNKVVLSVYPSGTYIIFR